MTWFPLWYLYIHNTKICLSLSIVHLSIYFFIGNAAVGLSFGQRFTKSYTSMLQYQSICLFSVLHNIVCVYGSSRRITWPTLGKHIMYIHTLCLGCTGFPHNPWTISCHVLHWRIGKNSVYMVHSYRVVGKNSWILKGTI